MPTSRRRTSRLALLAGSARGAREGPGRTEGSGTMREERGSRLRRGLRRGECRVCHRRDGAMRRCPCRVSARLAVVMRALRSEAEAGARVASALDCTVVVLAPPLDPAGSIRGNVLSDHEVTMLGDRARRRDDHSVHCIEGCVNEPRHRGVRRRLLGCVPTICRYGRRPHPTSRVESHVTAGLP